MNNMQNMHGLCNIKSVDFGNLSLWQANKVIRDEDAPAFHLSDLHKICEHYQYRDSTQCIQLTQILDGRDGFYKYQLEARPWSYDATPTAKLAMYKTMRDMMGDDA